MSSLADHQRSFMAMLLDDTQPLIADWNKRNEAGLAVYRNNYRTALVEALRSAFERTERLAGEAAFRRAAIHHVILNPPAGWTLDTVGDGFDATCAQLFANNPEVGALARLEWSMHVAFVGRDASAISAADFAQQCIAIGDGAWTGMKLDFVPLVSFGPVEFNLARLWSSLDQLGAEPEIEPLVAPHHVLVWREEERPVFVLQSVAEARAVTAMVQGAVWGDVCQDLAEQFGEDTAAAEAGGMLCGWIALGLVGKIGIR